MFILDDTKLRRHKPTWVDILLKKVNCPFLSTYYYKGSPADVCEAAGTKICD